MSKIPRELRYTKSHEWARTEEDGTITVGISDHAQDALGDVVFVELPDSDMELAQGDDAAVVESVKAASDVYSPVTGTVVAVNAALQNAPELVNSDPYGDGWFFRIRPVNLDDVERLLSADDYGRVCDQDAH